MNESAATQERFWLDESADCPVPPGRVLVDNEVAFLEHVCSKEPLFVQGASLCRWARAVALARRWSVRSIETPARALHTAHPELSWEAARMVVEQLGDRVWQLPVPPRAADVLVALFGESLRDGVPGVAHAARWLFWWVTHQPGGAERALAIATGQQWSAETNDSFLQECYTTRDPEDAEARLEAWLGLVPNEPGPRWPGIELPAEIQERLIRRARHRLVRDGILWEPPSEEQLWSSLQVPLACEIVAYLGQHSHQVTDQWLAWLERHLGQDELGPVRRLHQPHDPGEPPAAVKDVIAWFETRYLPWRRWVAISDDDAARRRSTEIGVAFGRWYLDTMPSLLAGSDENAYLAWVRAFRLKDDREYVTLLVVGDGFTPNDVTTFIRHLRHRVPQLRIITKEWAFAVPPTVTAFTKPTLLSQELTSRLVDEHGEGASYRVNQVRDFLQRASPGDVVAWVLTEPDRTYHRSCDDSELSVAVDGQLYAICGHLNTIVEQVPPEVRLQVVVTSDHGRYLGASRRTIATPDGLQPHGRAAWGNGAQENKITETYRINGNIAWLNPSAYGLPAYGQYAVIIDDQAFVTADGKGGVEQFAHGGLFPEEVLVPWVVLRREAHIDPILVAIAGEGIVGQLGNLSLEVVNPNSFAVELVTLSLAPHGAHGLAIKIPLGETIVARSTQELTLPLAPWPDTDPDVSVPATVQYRFPDGSTVETRASARLTSRALYRKDDILRDLL